jgi:hypothetical protein
VSVGETAIILITNRETAMKVELRDVLQVCRIKEGDTAPHYLLGYLWASLSEKKQQQISDDLQRRIDK